jgi:hypothetical protein
MSNEIELYNKSQLSKYEDAKEDLDKIMKANLYPSARDTYDIAKKQGLDLTMKQVKYYLQSQTPYQLTHENHQTKASMGYMVSFSPWSITQIDLLDLSKYSYDYSQFKSKKKLEGIKTDFNNGYKYVLIFIDIFSRYVDAVMLKSKNIEDCIHSLKIILDFNNISPNVIMSDSESSFLSKPFQEFLSERHIKHDVVVLNNHRSLGVIDRFCRTLRQRLTKLFIGRGDTSWVDDLATIIYQYNESPNRGILNYSPIQILKEPKAQEEILELNHMKASKNQELRSKSDIKPGDKVRLFIENTFKKNSEPSYTSKVFTVSSVSGKNLTLDNGKRVVNHNVLKINDSQYIDNNLLLENEENEEVLNPIEETNKENKITKKLKQAGIERPTYETLHESRSRRNVAPVDYKKLNKG